VAASPKKRKKNAVKTQKKIFRCVAECYTFFKKKKMGCSFLPKKKVIG
jgi:hypothetical protein